MSFREPPAVRKVGLYFLFVILAIFLAYGVFLALISLWAGLNHLGRDGFWMPILVGGTGTLGILWLSLRLSKFIFHRMKEKDILDL
jgi:hypothetical protein